MSDWIDVKDRLPEFTRTEYDWYCSDWVLVWNGRYHLIAVYEQYPDQEPRFVGDGPDRHEISDVEYWMPLPPGPKK